MSAPSLFALLKPFLWLGLAAFLTGFVSFLALARAPASATAPSDYAARVSAPPSEVWNLPKHI